MRDQTVDRYLSELADRIPAPGGGAAAALHAAQSAALLAMVARYSDGPKYDAALMGVIIDEADELRERALRLAQEDAAAFAAVAAAYKSQAYKSGSAERAERIAAALAGAAQPPADLVAVADQLISLAEDLVPAGNRNLIADVAAAAAAARAAAVTAQVNIEVNLRGITDAALADSLRATAARADDIAARADRVVSAVRTEIAR
jgi:methenyltetrahydrofolate cyclohydrolase